MASITKRGQRWSVQIRRKGVPTISKTFGSHADAKAWASIQEARIEQGEAPIPLRLLRGTSLGDILDRYIDEITPTKRSADTERSRLLKLCRDEVAAVPLASLESRHLATYRDRRLREVKAGTVRRELSLIHHALDVARKEWGFRLPLNPVAQLSLPALNNARDRRLADGEWGRLSVALAGCRNPLIRPVVQFAIETGMRRGEILDLRWSRVDLATSTAHVPQTKTGKPRTVPLTPGASRILLKLPRVATQVFPVTANALRLSWERVVDRAGITDLRFHDLRHEAISRFFFGSSRSQDAVPLHPYACSRPCNQDEGLGGRRGKPSVSVNSPLVIGGGHRLPT